MWPADEVSGQAPGQSDPATVAHRCRMANHTTLTVREGDRERLRQFAADEFGSEDVPYRVTINHLIDQYDD
jgi:hypothetical protein